MFTKKESDRCSPDELLITHFRLREAGHSVLSTLVGDPADARAVWGRVSKNLGFIPGTVPGCDVASAEDAFKFYEKLPPQLKNSSALLLVSSKIAVPEFLKCLNFVQQHSGKALGIVASHANIRSVLDDPILTTHYCAEFIKGLIFLDSDTPPSKAKKKDVLYRSDHEEIIHKLLLAHPNFAEEFEPNHSQMGGSGSRYEVDFFCADLKLALEIDGSQHWKHRAQIERDKVRDRDLASNGIDTLRVRADKILEDPTAVLKLLSQRIEEIKRNQRKNE